MDNVLGLLLSIVFLAFLVVVVTMKEIKQIKFCDVFVVHHHVNVWEGLMVC